MAPSSTLERYQLKLAAMIAEAHRRHINDDRECVTTIRLLERHLAIIDAMTPAERQNVAWLNEESAQTRLESRCDASHEDVAAFLTWWHATQRELDEYFKKFAETQPTSRDVTQANYDQIKPKKS